ALDVAAREPALVATSITAWHGWKAALDGREIPAVSYNHAFLGFRVPAGRHRLVLRYASGAFRAGAAVSLVSLGLALALLLRGRRDRRPPAG
ncbi:MAG: YfhO family protein, partial [Thermoanaerobaculia bacterium]